VRNRSSCPIHVHLHPGRRGETSSPQERQGLTGGLPYINRVLKNITSTNLQPTAFIGFPY
jgi:hypothetical protein